MKRFPTLIALTLFLATMAAGQTPPALHGTVTDPSGAVVPGALVQVRGPGGEQRKATDSAGTYSFPALARGKYLVRAIAKGFTVADKPDFDIEGPATLDFQLTIQVESQVVNVEDEANKVSADPAANGGALVLKQKELEALSDDPDELQQQLQAMAGPGAGPNGGQIYIDGFTGGQLPSKSSIREVRINANPFSPEYDKMGFGRIEVFTKPGTDQIHGQLFGQFNNQALNSRSPLLLQAKPPYRQELFGVNLSGPISKRKASFVFDGQRRSTNENALILATDLDSNLNPRIVNQAVLTPQTFTTLAPRLDYAITPRHSLTVRYQNTRVERDQVGVGDFSLVSRGYNLNSSENTLQVTENAVLSARFLNETRFQYMHTNLADTGGSTLPALVVQGAFTGGGAQVGNSGNRANLLEMTNTSTFTRKSHTIKWGGRLRQSNRDSTSLNNFGGTYTFLGGQGPQLDANNQPIPGTAIPLEALEVYRRTLLFQKRSDAEIRQLGGGAYLFTLAGGIPASSVKQFDIGLFLSDDWRPRQNLTLSFGMRYETQTNIGDLGDWAPRVGVAWGIDAKGNKPAKTVLRAGFGVFYDRIGDGAILNALRFNGVTQQSYAVFHPEFFPAIPTADSLGSARQPQTLQFVDAAIRAPENYQASLGLDRQVNKMFRLSFNYIGARGVHLQRSRDINAPLAGLFPFGDAQLRMLTETTGFSRYHLMTLTPSVTYKKVTVFGYYMLSHGKTDAEGQPANPYNLRAEWGPSSFSDIRHTAVIGGSVTLPGKISANPFLILRTGSPYNITTGLDSNGDSIAAERPALLAGVGPAACVSPGLEFQPAFGCFNLNPGPGAATIERNAARGPGNISTMLRVARTWSFGRKGENASAGGASVSAGNARAAAQAAAFGIPAGALGLGGGGARKFNLTLSVSAANPLNHVNFAPPSGDLSSPYFGAYRGLNSLLGPSSTYNRKVDVQLRLGF